MSIESYIEAMPKAELHVHLEGAISPDALLLMAEQNEIAEQLKHFDTWAALVQKPDYQRLDDLIRIVCQWFQLPEDLTRAVYDVGTNLWKQNVRYAEVTVNPALFTELQVPLDQFFAALNDGRDRAERAWGIRIAWILAVPRDEPRRADEYVRFASSAAGRKANVVALGLAGKETVQPAGQFERAFQAAEKKGLPRVVHAGEVLGGAGIVDAIQSLLPNRIAGAWGAADSEEALNLLREQSIALELSLVRALRLGKIATYPEYPLRRLYDDGIVVTVGSDMPAFLQTSLNEQYAAVVSEMDFSLEELDDIALNAVRASFLPEDERDALVEEFRQAYIDLRAEDVETQAE